MVPFSINYEATTCSSYKLEKILEIMRKNNKTSHHPLSFKPVEPFFPNIKFILYIKKQIPTTPPPPSSPPVYLIQESRTRLGI